MTVKGAWWTAGQQVELSLLLHSQVRYLTCVSTYKQLAKVQEFCLHKTVVSRVAHWCCLCPVLL